MIKTIIKNFIILFFILLLYPFSALATDTNMILQEPKFFNDNGEIEVTPKDDGFNIFPDYDNDYDYDYDYDNEHDEDNIVHIKEIKSNFLINGLRNIKNIIVIFVFYIFFPIIAIFFLVSLVLSKVFNVNIININFKEFNKIKDKSKNKKR